MTENTQNETELSGAQYERLLDIGRAIVSELDLENVLRSVLDAARDLTGARYAALGILDQEKRELERFVYVGIDEETRHAIGPLPRGRGVLGELIRRPEPLRLKDVGTHERSYGFPANHPPMKSFLGTPVVIRGEAWGNLYLTEKSNATEFTDGDENVAIILAAWAAVAIENARLYEGLAERGAELERVMKGLEMSSDISRAGASGMSVGPLIELISKRGRSLVEAETVLVLVAEEGGLVVAGTAGEAATEILARRIPDEQSIPSELGVEPGSGQELLISALPFRGRRSGVLVAIGRDGKCFDDEDRRAFDSYAIGAATTIASVRSAEAEKMKLSIQASEREKQRWARELHDQTLQELGALRFLLESAAKGTTKELQEACGRAIEHVDRGIQNLQGLITELRPATLDELGVGPAIEALARDASESHQAEVEANLRLAYDDGRAADRLSPDLEAAIYRLVQEGVNNALKHAEADSVVIGVVEDDQSVTITVTDDGRGFDPSAETGRFGLVGMRERVDLADGEIEIESKPGKGTTVRIRLPVARATEAGATSPKPDPAGAA